jgi:hypothetical protein
LARRSERYGRRSVTALLLAVEVETGIRHLHGHCGAGRVRLAVIGARSRHHDQIGLGRGLVVEGHRHLSAHDPAWWEENPQRIIDGANGGGVVATLRLSDDEMPAEELHGIALEHTEIHESLVLDPLPAPKRQRDLLHTSTLAGSRGVINVDSWIHDWRVKLRRGAPPTCIA